MCVAILADGPDLSAYVGEILKTWGLALFETVGPDGLAALDPSRTHVVICPASPRTERLAAELLRYAERGGTVVCFLPQGQLASAAGLRPMGDKPLPAVLRMTAFPAAGAAGELLPVVGAAQTYEASERAAVLAYLSDPERYEGESVGIVENKVGDGKIVAFAFDLPLCVLLERQGRPGGAEAIPSGDSCARPSHGAVETPSAAGWAPFADLLARLLVDLVRRYSALPLPLLGHLPGVAPTLLLYSGDEDAAEVAHVDAQLDWLTRHGARMNLYVIANRTKSTPQDVQRYARNHDVGPHPDLRPLDGQPVAQRLEELERQIRMFQDMFGITPRSVRNHCTAWAGYLEPVEVLQRLGVRMEASYFSGGYARNRRCAPYADFGGAMPMRFCSPDGTLLDVFQQHTHVSDDLMFGPQDYSCKLSPETYEAVLDRILSDAAGRFHTPYAVCIHPGGWAQYSQPQGQALVRQAAGRDIPIWSFDQWSRFWDARDTWRIRRLQWDGARLTFTAEGAQWHEGLSLWLPTEHAGLTLQDLRVDGQPASWHPTTRYCQSLAAVPIPDGKTALSVTARYA